jgi:hypothetical protein
MNAHHYFWRRKVDMWKLLGSFSNIARIRKSGTGNWSPLERASDGDMWRLFGSFWSTVRM